MKTVQVHGRFIQPSGKPSTGKVSFIPSKMWYEEDGVLYANLAREVTLDEGKFQVELDRTDQTSVPWHYTVLCPIGRWTVFLTEDGPTQLRDLIPKRMA